jgi:undecaprenyl-diphosphatase
VGTFFSGFADWDRAAFDAINHVASNAVMDWLMPVLSSAALWFVPLGIAWLVYFIRTNRRGRLIAIGCFLVIAATDQLSSSVLKPAIARQRPCNVVPATRFYQDGTWLTTDKFGLTIYKSSFSFPSSHAANVAGQAVYWGAFYPQITPLLTIAAISVGFSRVYLGHHWPGDILAGYVLGFAVALMIARFLRQFVLPREDE